MYEQIEKHSLDKSVRKFVPVDIMAIFEMRQAGDTIDRCAEMRKEVCSFIDIAIDSRRLNKMYINFPKYNLVKLRRLLKPYGAAPDQTSPSSQTSGQPVNSSKNRSLLELESLEPRLSAILRPLFAEEAIFYE